MTSRELLRERLPLMQAWCDGKPAQVRNLINRDAPANVWRDCDDPPWLNPLLEVRLKPEPREFWIAKPKRSLSTSNVYVATSKQTAEEVVDGHGGTWETIHVREVLP